MSFDLDIALNLIIIALIVFIAAIALRASRKADYNKSAISANSKAIEQLPVELASIIGDWIAQSKEVVKLLKEDADRLQEYQNILREKNLLTVANANLSATLTAREGEIVSLRDITFRLDALNKERQMENTKLINANAEHARAVEALARDLEAMRLLVEQLTAALNGSKQ